MWELDYKESWSRRTDAFELWCWRRLLRVPWTARRSYQSILKETSPEYSLEGLMLKLKLQYFGHLMQRADSFEKTLMVWKIEGSRRRGQQRMNWLECITDSMDMRLSELREFGDVQGGLACYGSWGRKESDTTERPNWTEWETFICYHSGTWNFLFNSFSIVLISYLSYQAIGYVMTLCLTSIKSIVLQS